MTAMDGAAPTVFSMAREPDGVGSNQLTSSVFFSV
jgi:hypothetical protein